MRGRGRREEEDVEGEEAGISVQSLGVAMSTIRCDPLPTSSPDPPLTTHLSTPLTLDLYSLLLVLDNEHEGNISI